MIYDSGDLEGIIYGNFVSYQHASKPCKYMKVMSDTNLSLIHRF